MLIRFLRHWMNFMPPAEAELSDPVAAILIQRGIAEVKAKSEELPKRAPGRPRKDKPNAHS